MTTFPDISLKRRHTARVERSRRVVVRWTITRVEADEQGLGTRHGNEGHRSPRDAAREGAVRASPEEEAGGPKGGIRAAAAAEAPATHGDEVRAATRRSCEEEDNRRARSHPVGGPEGRDGHRTLAAPRDDLDRPPYGCLPALTARPKGLPSESLQIAHRSPGCTTLPPSASTRSSASARSLTAK